MLLLLVSGPLTVPVQAERVTIQLQATNVGGLENRKADTGLPEEGKLQRPPQPITPIEKSLAEKVATMSPVEMIRVIVFLDYQPQAVISRQVREKHAVEAREIRLQTESLRRKYTTKRNLKAPTDAANYTAQILTPGSADRLALAKLNERNETLSLKVKNEMASALHKALQPYQSSVREEIIGLGGQVEFTTIAVDALVALVPAGAIDRLALLDKVVRVAADEKTYAHLDIADDAALVTSSKNGGGLRDNGECGGIYDPAVLDTGTDLAHPALQDTTGRSNFYSWYLVAGYADPFWNDVTTEDDLQGHGSHVLGIVASYGSGGWSNHLGMAHCVEKAVTLKAGWRTTGGDGAMYRTDAMQLVDRALYNDDDLQPLNSFNDDVDGINLSFGSDSGDDETDYSRFYDSIVYTYPDLLVTISAGNSGPTNPIFATPANNYNAITVANVQDFGTVDRDDDTIRPSSTRGPTANGRRKPDIAAPGSLIASANNNWETQSDFINKSGTSMSAPMIQGIAMDLMDAGVFDELEIKALLLNTAQKNEPGINFESDADGWDPAYGWGYVNAWAAYSHRNDVRTDSVTPRNQDGDFVLYKGQMRDEGSIGEGRDRATMVWNRHAEYNTAAYPVTFYALSDLNLHLYDESDNTLIDFDTNTIDNVHQVRVDAGAPFTDVVVKAYAWSTSFDHGLATETFALATEEDFAKVDLPADFSAFVTKPVEIEPNEEQDWTFWIRNDSDIASHNNQYELVLPAGWARVSGDPAVFDAGSAAGGGGFAAEVTWRLRAPPTPVGAQSVVVRHSHNSYAEAWGPHSFSISAQVVFDTTPPSPNPMTWSTLPYDTGLTSIAMQATVATDLHGPVEYQFFANSLTGGGGATTSGWQTATGYTDSGLGVNHQYRYWVRARDTATTPNVTGWSVQSDEFTAIETPSGITFGTITSGSIEARSSNTPSNLNLGASGLWIGNMTNATSSGWKKNNDFWSSGGLDPNTQYCFRAKASNGDGEATPLSPVACRYTLANSPNTFGFSDITETGIRVNWKANGNPAGTEYRVENVTNGSTSGWTTALTWNNTGLTCGTAYSYRIRARNGDGVATNWVAMGTPSTLPCPDDDGDGVPNHLDNCILRPNGPLIPDLGGNIQRDTDGDGFGNVCDPDFNNNLVVDALDFSKLKSVFGSTSAPDQDLNGNGQVDPLDFSLLKSFFGQPPGPSGLVP